MKTYLVRISSVLCAGILFSFGALAPAAAQSNSQFFVATHSPKSISVAIKKKYRRQIVAYKADHEPGTIVVNTKSRHLFLVMEGGKALRYGIGVGRRGLAWRGSATIRRKAKWPTWTPTKNMIRRDPKLARWANGMRGGKHNPLGARALYLYRGGRDTLYRIHGTNEPSSIGRAVSSGCIRLLNSDIRHLYERAAIGAKVVVL